MRFHFPTHAAPVSDGYAITPRDIAVEALKNCKDRGQIANHVTFDVLDTKGRRGGGSALEIQLRANGHDRGRRPRNSGSGGAVRSSTYFGGPNLAATYDEWGFFIEEMFSLTGGEMLVGSPSMPQYASLKDFHHKTGRTYDPGYPDEVEKWGDIYRYKVGRNDVGRRGSGRVNSTIGTSGRLVTTYDPRSADYLRGLQAGAL